MPLTQPTYPHYAPQLPRCWGLDRALKNPRAGLTDSSQLHIIFSLGRQIPALQLEVIYQRGASSQVHKKQTQALSFALWCFELKVDTREWVSDWVSGWVSGWVGEWLSEWVTAHMIRVISHMKVTCEKSIFFCDQPSKSSFSLHQEFNHDSLRENQWPGTYLSLTPSPDSEIPQTALGHGRGRAGESGGLQV